MFNKNNPTVLEQQGIIQPLIALILFAAVAATAYLVFQTQNIKENILFKVDNQKASFSLIQRSNITDGQVIVDLYTKSEVDEANLFSAKLKFPKEFLKVLRIETNSAIIKIWVENSFNNETGIISLVGGVPNPGYKTKVSESPELLVSIYFEITNRDADEIATISFDDSSAIYSNSDNSNILSGTNNLEVKMNQE